jgi:hypothetical protein
MSRIVIVILIYHRHKSTVLMPTTSFCILQIEFWGRGRGLSYCDTHKVEDRIIQVPARKPDVSKLVVS